MAFNYNYDPNGGQPGQPAQSAEPGGQVSDMFPSLWPNQAELDHATSSCLTNVFFRMFAALLVTAASAIAVTESIAMQSFIFGNMFVFYGLIIMELGLVFAISAGIKKLSPTAANVLFFTYAIINGLTLSIIFFVYEIGIIYHAFAIAALMFAAMAIFGAVTRKDLSTIGNICFMALIGIIIATFVNFFARSDMIFNIVSYVGVLVFVGLTAYDTQRIKRMLREANAVSHEVAIKKVSVMGALTLYLDFINMFLMILRIMGRRR